MKKAWLLRPSPHNINRISNFKEDNLVAIGWPEISSLDHKDKAEIKELLKGHPNNYTPSQLGSALSTVDIFVNQMSKDDLIVVPNEDDIYFAKIKDDYFYEESKVDDGYPHQRKVKWLKDGPVSRDNLPDDLRNSLKAPMTAADLSDHIDLIKKIIDTKSPIGTTTLLDYMEVSYPLRTDMNSTITIPKNITKKEASRLSKFVKTLYFDEEDD